MAICLFMYLEIVQMFGVIESFSQYLRTVIYINKVESRPITFLKRDNYGATLFIGGTNTKEPNLVGGEEDLLDSLNRLIYCE